MISVQSKNLGDWIYKYIYNNINKNIIYYNGANMEVDEDGVTMLERKWKDF